jgi:DNA-binding NarL/FixJ family response regulator
VLLVEDNPGDARLFRESLAESRGVAWEVEYAGLLSSALHRLEQSGIDVVALDLGLPDAQGTEAVARLRERAPDIPIVVLTGVSDEAVGMRAMQQGAEDYLVKGQVASDRLSSVLLYAVARKRSEEETLASLALLTATLEVASDGILVLDREGRIARFNQRFVDIWRIPRPVVGSPGESWSQFRVLEQLADPQAFLAAAQLLRARPDAEVSDALEFEDGRVIERRSLPHCLRGAPVGRVWSFRDVSELRRTQAALRDALDRLERQEAPGRP